MTSLANIVYSDDETAQINQWLTTAERLKTGVSEADQVSLLNQLNEHLATRTTLLGEKLSKADVAIYQSLASLVSSWSAEERTGKDGRPNIVRHLDFIQNAPSLNLSLNDSEKVKVNPDEICYVKPPLDAKAERERLKKEKTALAAASKAADGDATTLVDRTITKAKDVIQKENVGTDTPKESKKGNLVGEAMESSQPRKKKEKAPKAPKPPAAAAPLSVSLIDLRVGHILKAIKHPEAETLFVSTIAMGDKPGTAETSEYEGQVVRTVCSGLNGLVPLEDMQGRKVIVVCNLKPVKMRGIKSAAMVLAASPKPKEGEDDHSKMVELVSPPPEAKAGEKVFFEGWKGEPEAILNPKKKVWETFQPGFTTTSDFEVGFVAAAVPAPSTEGTESAAKVVAKLVTESGGVCKVKTLANAVVR